MRTLWFICHVPKTGGQTVRDHLAQEFERGVEYFHLGKWDRDADLTYDDIDALGAKARSLIHVVGGHPLERRFADLFPGRPIREVVFIREPTARLVSLYNFRMTLLSRQGGPTVSFEEFLDADRKNFTTTFLARFFGVENQRKCLGDVLNALSHAWLVGRTENMDTILPYLFGEMGLPPTRPNRTNVTGETIDRWVTLTPDLADEIHRRNPIDTMLYSSVERFERRYLERMDAVSSTLTRRPVGFVPQ